MDVRMSTYTQYKYWSIIEGCNVMRLSMRNDRGDEYFSIVPCGSSGKAARQARENALDVISDAIERGDEPGQVMMKETV